MVEFAKELLYALFCISLIALISYWADSFYSLKCHGY